MQIEVMVKDGHNFFKWQDVYHMTMEYYPFQENLVEYFLAFELFLHL